MGKIFAIEPRCVIARIHMPDDADAWDAQMAWRDYCESQDAPIGALAVGGIEAVEESDGYPPEERARRLPVGAVQLSQPWLNVPIRLFMQAFPVGDDTHG